MHRSLLLLLATFGVLLAPRVGLTQASFPIENHYKVYYVQPNPTISGPLRLDDQWGTSHYDLGAVLFNFANPVQKNGSQIFFPLVHHTWWFLPSNNLAPSRTVNLDNQFGRQTWTVNYAEYLLVPAPKSLPPQEPPPAAASEHRQSLQVLRGDRAASERAGEPDRSIRPDDGYGTRSSVLL
jgi:hypothetical protein